MSCQFHPKYKAIQPPRCECIECWLMFLEPRPEFVQVINKAMALIVSAQYAGGGG